MKKSVRVKILIVDDRENNLLSMESILWQDGYTIVRANSGKEALKILLKDYDFTLILMDVEMPDLNGFETATMIYQREKLKHIPIIFITAHSYGDENLFKGYRAGAVDYIYKPIQPELLRVKVFVFVELYKKNHQLMAQEQPLERLPIPALMNQKPINLVWFSLPWRVTILTSLLPSGNVCLPKAEPSRRIFSARIPAMPPASMTYRREPPPPRFDTKRICFPSGDHAGS